MSDDTYGFETDDEMDPISLPSFDKEKETNSLSKEVIEKAVKAGHELGFVSREEPTRRKPGPRQKEKQGKLHLTGPERVIAQFRQQAGEMVYWEYLEILLDKDKKKKR